MTTPHQRSATTTTSILDDASIGKDARRGGIVKLAAAAAAADGQALWSQALNLTAVATYRRKDAGSEFKRLFLYTRRATRQLGRCDAYLRLTRRAPAARCVMLQRRRKKRAHVPLFLLSQAGWTS